MDEDHHSREPLTDTAALSNTGAEWGAMESGATEVLEGAVVGHGGPRRYEVSKLLGRGGMGEVHLARDERVGRDVALKVLVEAGRSRDDVRASFFREARLQGLLEHPGIVPVHDLDRDEAGRDFFVMKRVVGTTLEEVVRGLKRGDPAVVQSFPTRRLLSAYLQACLTVDYAHSRGVVHRDLKLSNLMLGDYGEVYVLDWGIAKVAAAEELGRDPVTGALATGVGMSSAYLLGTPGYMAPEQIDDARSVDARADVYALGVILFSVLTHERLHAGSNAKQLAESTQQGVDARPTVKAPHKEIPPEYDAICVKATAVDPAQRYPNVRALHDAVERVLDGDRDMRLRLELASQHLADAKRALDAASQTSSGGSDARRLALHHAARSLALHPESKEAAALVSTLMLTPPDDIPPEVELETRELGQRELERTAFSGGIVALVVLGCVVALLHWVGVRSWSALSLFLLPLGAASLLGIVRNLPTHPVLGNLVAAVFVALTIAGSSRIVGSLWLPPLAASLYVAIISWSHSLGRWRIVCVALAIAGALVPWLLEAAGLTTSQYVFEGGSVRITADAVAFHPGRAEMAFALGSSLIIAAASVAFWRFSRADMETRQRLQLVAWHLRHLAPSTDSTSGDAARPSRPASSAASTPEKVGGDQPATPDDITATRANRRR